MAAWIKVESALRRHRKVIRLGKLLGLADERTLVGGLVLLWLSVRETAPDGDITSWKATDVAAAAGFDDADADRLFFALHEVGFLDGSDGSVRCHDWMSHNGDFLWCNSNRERQQSAGRARAAKATRDEAGHFLPATQPESSPGSSSQAGTAGPAASGAGAGARAGQESKSTHLSAPVVADMSVALAAEPLSLEIEPPPAARPKDEWLEGFELWYPDYPNKNKKPRALKAWKAISGPHTQEAFDLICAGTDAWIGYWKRTSTETAKIPHPATFINGRQWEDPTP